MRKLIHNERGSGLFFTMFYIMIFGIALILILNIALVFMEKGQANIAAEQASLAATSVIYKEVIPIVNSHVKIIEVKDADGNIIEIIKEPLIDKFNIVKISIGNANSELSHNEVDFLAANKVLIQEIPDDEELSNKISGALSSAKSKISSVVERIIRDNGGKDSPTEYDWFLNEHNRIEVLAKSEFEAVHHNGINFGSDNDISQRGEGPTISLFEIISW